MCHRRKTWLRLSLCLVTLAWVSGCRVAPLGGPAGELAIPALDVDFTLETTKTTSPPRPIPPSPTPPTLTQRLEVPADVPGANLPPINLPPLDDKTTPGERDRLLREIYETLPGLPEDPVPNTGVQVGLQEMQQEASSHHPAIRVAAAAVESARGAATQAGLPPNPVFGFEADTIGSGGTAGQQGAKYEQLIKTAGKLRLAQLAALMDVVNAQVALRRAQIDIATQVRTAYFNVLLAEENLRLSHALCRFAESIFRVQVDQVRAGQAAPYEPLALRALAEQARTVLSQSHNKYQAAWRQLAAATGKMDMQPTALTGHVSMGEPLLPYDTLRERMLSCHTDLITAANTVNKWRYNVALAKVTPVPDIALKLVVQKDFSTPPFAACSNVEIGVPIPVWDRNQGGIRQAEAEVSRAIEDIPRIRLDLLAKLAEATERYQSNRQIVDAYLLHVLPDQVRVYRGIVQRSQQEPDRASFGDIVTAQLQLNSFLTTYLAALQGQWQAAVDLAALAQLDDLYQFGAYPLGAADVAGKSPESLPKP